MKLKTVLTFTAAVLDAVETAATLLFWCYDIEFQSHYDHVCSDLLQLS